MKRFKFTRLVILSRNSKLWEVNANFELFQNTSTVMALHTYASDKGVKWGEKNECPLCFIHVIIFTCHFLGYTVRTRKLFFFFLWVKGNNCKIIILTLKTSASDLNGQVQQFLIIDSYVLSFIWWYLSGSVFFSFQYFCFGFHLWIMECLMHLVQR